MRGQCANTNHPNTVKEQGNMNEITPTTLLSSPGVGLVVSIVKNFKVYMSKRMIFAEHNASLSSVQEKMAKIVV